MLVPLKFKAAFREDAAGYPGLKISDSQCLGNLPSSDEKSHQWRIPLLSMAIMFDSRRGIQSLEIWNNQDGFDILMLMLIHNGGLLGGRASSPEGFKEGKAHHNTQ